MRIIFSTYTDAGMVRETNQDSIFAAANGEYGLFAAADGMGGHFCGEIASRRITTALKEWWDSFISEPCGFEECYEELRSLLCRINSEIYGEYSQNGRICGSTAAVLFIFGGRYIVMNSGDTRIYSRRGINIRQESTDHTYGREAVISGIMTKAEAKLSVDRDKLTSAVGCYSELKLNALSAPLDRTGFFICTDGVYKYCGSLFTAVSMFMKEPCDLIAYKVKKRGAADNYSFITIRILK